MTRPALAVLALAFFLAHLPHLASSLEDIDSVNFALGVRDFDVADHRPHPPGYPVYIALGKLGVAATTRILPDWSRSAVEARALSVLSLAGALAVIALLYRVLAAWDTDSEADHLSTPWRRLDPGALAATALAVACPLFWYMSVRPMSDVPGLAAALAAQACLALAWWRQQPDASGDRRLTPERMVASGRLVVLGALLAGCSIGVRSQNAVLTVPLLIGVLFDRVGRGAAGALLGGGIAFAAGVLVWAVPLIVASGGPSAYLASLGVQAGEDFAGVEMLSLNPSPRLVAQALVRTLIYPWDSVLLGGIVIALAAVGAVVLLIRDRRALAVVASVSVPYLLFHLAFHDTTFVRYALPLVPPVAYLAVRGGELLVRKAALPIVGGLALWAVSIAAPTLGAYAGEPSPTVRALAAMEEAAESAPPGALAMHQTFRRPLQAEPISIGPQLPSPPRREWLSLAEYWRGGRTEPVWFLADPRRTDLALIDPQARAERQEFSWQLSSLNELGGMRPSAVHWYRLALPGWFAEEGWALTPETAGMARLMGRGPSIGPITARVRRRDDAMHALVGGRHLGAPGSPPVRIVVGLDGEDVAQWDVEPGFFLHEFDLPAGALAGEGTFAALTIRAESREGEPSPAAIEQFDIQPRGTLMWAYDEGWHEAEFAPALGVWRWTSERAVLRVVGGVGTPLSVRLRVESPLRYFDDAPVVRMYAGDDLLSETRLADSPLWSVDVPPSALARSGGRLVVETSRTFVPAERDGGADRRRLGLRVFEVVLAAQH